VIPRRRFLVLATAIAIGIAFYPGDVPGGTWVGLAILNALLAVLVLADWVLAPRTDRFTISREHPHATVLGTTGTIAWRVDNPGERSLRVRLIDDLAPSLHAETRRCELTVPAHSVATASTSFVPERRGRFEAVDLTVAVTGPLGLVWRQRVVPTPTSLHVHPPFRSRKVADAKIRRARTLELGSRTSRGLGGGSEFEQLREYTHEDQFRHIDWGATARTGRPIVRVYQPEPNQSVIVLLDNGRLMAGNVGDVPRLEHGIDATIALATVAVALGDRVGLVTFDQRPLDVVPPHSSATQVSRLTNAMFDLFPALLESDYREVFRSTVARFRRRSLLVLVTELTGAAARESLFPALPTLVRHHSVLIACVRDPELTSWADGAVTDADEAFRASAAAAALRERQHLLAQARALGANVIDAEPGALPGHVADAYINWKIRGVR
jgi:uncharacterized protein (DUF58 family)